MHRHYALLEYACNQVVRLGEYCEAENATFSTLEIKIKEITSNF